MQELPGAMDTPPSGQLPAKGRKRFERLVKIKLKLSRVFDDPRWIYKVLLLHELIQPSRAEIVWNLCLAFPKKLLRRLSVSDQTDDVVKIHTTGGVQWRPVSTAAMPTRKSMTSPSKNQGHSLSRAVIRKVDDGRREENLAPQTRPRTSTHPHTQ